MRSQIVFALLLALAGALGFVIFKRTRAPRAVAVAPRVSMPRDDAGAPLASRGGGDGGAAADGALVGAATDGGPRVASHDGGRAVPPRMDRPLRVSALGWELLAPGIIANHGALPGTGSAFTADGLTVHLTAAESPAAIEAALARGGNDPRGADIAVLPLPTFVASYERLRALAPEVFFVVGWSHGREGVASSHAAALTTPPSASEVRVAGEPGSAAAFVALCALDLAGVPVNRLALVSTEGRSVSSAPVAAVDRSEPPEPGEDATPRRMLLTTADASRLVPFVAVAPHGFIQSHAEPLKAWARAWLGGMDELRADVPGAARTVAEASGAPDALALLQRLGLTEGTTLRDNARVMGLAGRGAVTLERLFQRSWRLWRAVGVLSTPAPETAPLATATVAALVRADPSLARGAPAPALGTAGATTLGGGTPPAGAAPVLVRRAPEGRFDETAFVDEIGFLAGVFERAPLRVSARPDASRARALLTNARDRFDLAPQRLFVGRSVPDNAPAAIEVLAVP